MNRHAHVPRRALRHQSPGCVRAVRTGGRSARRPRRGNLMRQVLDSAVRPYTSRGQAACCWVTLVTLGIGSPRKIILKSVRTVFRTLHFDGTFHSENLALIKRTGNTPLGSLWARSFGSVQQTATQIVTTRSQVIGSVIGLACRVIHRLHPVPPPGDPQERLLNQILGILEVSDHQIARAEKGVRRLGREASN